MSDQCDHDWTRLKSLVLYPLGNQNAPAPLEWCKHCGLLRMCGSKPREDTAKEEVHAKPGPCPFCGKPGTLHQLWNDTCMVFCECGCRGPVKATPTEAVQSWHAIHVYMQGPFGTIKHHAGIEAIDDIHSLREHCAKRGMPNDPIDCPGKPGSMRNQIIRFIDKLVEIRDSHYEALRERKM